MSWVARGPISSTAAEAVGDLDCYICAEHGTDAGVSVGVVAADDRVASADLGAADLFGAQLHHLQRGFNIRGCSAELEGRAIGTVGEADGAQADRRLTRRGAEVGGDPATVAWHHRGSVLAQDCVERPRDRCRGRVR